MAETLQSDLRHSVLFFLPDLAGSAYRRHPLFGEAVRRFEPTKGETWVEAIIETDQSLISEDASFSLAAD